MGTEGYEEARKKTVMTSERERLHKMRKKMPKLASGEGTQKLPAWWRPHRSQRLPK